MLLYVSEPSALDIDMLSQLEENWFSAVVKIHGGSTACFMFLWEFWMVDACCMLDSVFDAF